jgi:hypothetical protein
VLCEVNGQPKNRVSINCGTGTSVLIMETPPKQKGSIRQQIFHGLLAGCAMELLIQLYLRFIFRSRHPVEINWLYEAAGGVLLISAVLLLISSLMMIGAKSKLVVWGLIVAVISILATTIFSQLNVVSA